MPLKPEILDHLVASKENYKALSKENKFLLDLILYLESHPEVDPKKHILKIGEYYTIKYNNSKYVFFHKSFNSRRLDIKNRLNDLIFDFIFPSLDTGVTIGEGKTLGITRELRFGPVTIRKKKPVKAEEPITSFKDFMIDAKKFLGDRNAFPSGTTVTATFFFSVDRERLDPKVSEKAYNLLIDEVLKRLVRLKNSSNRSELRFITNYNHVGLYSDLDVLHNEGVTLYFGALEGIYQHMVILLDGYSDKKMDLDSKNSGNGKHKRFKYILKWDPLTGIIITGKDNDTAKASILKTRFFEHHHARTERIIQLGNSPDDGGSANSLQRLSDFNIVVIDDKPRRRADDKEASDGASTIARLVKSIDEHYGLESVENGQDTYAKSRVIHNDLRRLFIETKGHRIDLIIAIVELLYRIKTFDPNSPGQDEEKRLFEEITSKRMLVSAISKLRTVLDNARAYLLRIDSLDSYEFNEFMRNLYSFPFANEKTIPAILQKHGIRFPNEPVGVRRDLALALTDKRCLSALAVAYKKEVQLSQGRDESGVDEDIELNDQELFSRVESRFKEIVMSFYTKQ